MTEDTFPAAEHDPLRSRRQRNGGRRVAAVEHMRRVASAIATLGLLVLLVFGHQEAETLYQPFLRIHRHFLSTTVIFFPEIRIFSMTRL